MFYRVHRLAIDNFEDKEYVENREYMENREHRE